MKDIRNNLDKEKRDIVIYDILVPSLRILYEEDYFNIAAGVSERNICARLAHHMENVMHEMNDYNDYYADVEYNRKNDGTGKNWESPHKVPLPMVADLIVHKRNAEHNLMSIEMKRWNNYDKRKEDRKRLESVVSSPNLEERRDDCIYDTALGIFIIYSHKILKVEFYENLDGNGAYSGYMLFECKMDGTSFLSLEKIDEKWVYVVNQDFYSDYYDTKICRGDKCIILQYLSNNYVAVNMLDTSKYPKKYLSIPMANLELCHEDW